MTETPQTFEVLINTSDEIPATAIAESIALFKQIPFQDAAHEARICWGFVGKNLTEESAHRLVTIMNGKNVPACIVKTDRIATLPPIDTVKAMQFESSGLHLTLSSGQVTVLMPFQLSAITAMGLPLRSVSTEKIVQGRTNAQKLLNVGLLMAGIPISVGKKKRVIEKTTVKEDLLFYADLLTTSPSQRFRVDAQGFNYSFLKERMVYNTLQNFKMMLADLTLFAPKARIGKGTRFFLKNLVLSQMGYESFDHLEREMCWLATLG